MNLGGYQDLSDEDLSEQSDDVEKDHSEKYLYSISESLRTDTESIQFIPSELSFKYFKNKEKIFKVLILLHNSA
jgi:hypothetical protein